MTELYELEINEMLRLEVLMDVSFGCRILQDVSCVHKDGCVLPEISPIWVACQLIVLSLVILLVVSIFCMERYSRSRLRYTTARIMIHCLPLVIIKLIWEHSMRYTLLIKVNGIPHKYEAIASSFTITILLFARRLSTLFLKHAIPPTLEEEELQEDQED